MTDDVQRIKEKIDLLEYLKPIIHLKPAGRNWKGLCPFHKEKTPSFMVSPERQIWHCFGGCNVGGDIFSFLMKYENINFYEALKVLAEKAGIDLKRTGSSDWQKYNRLYEINEAAAVFFQNNLHQIVSDNDQERDRQLVIGYLRQRGLRPETINEFGLGLALFHSDGLLRHLTRLGFSAAETEQAGLVFRTERGTYWDRFRERLMFPLYNTFGKIIGFTGRTLEGITAVEGGAVARLGKYVNSPETPIFQKAKFLYGFHQTKNFIREKRLAVLVEGQMDFLLAWQDGVQNIIATSGTALTEDHLILLKRAADQLVLGFDNDSAGQLAMERSIELAFSQDFSVKILIIPNTFAGVDLRQCKDPAEIVHSYPKILGQLIDRAIPAVHYYFLRYLKDARDVYQQKHGVRAVLSKLRQIASPVERAVWLKELAQKSGIAEAVLEEELKVLAQDLSSSKQSVGQRQTELITATIARKDRIAQRIFGIVYHQPNLLERVLTDRSFIPSGYQIFIDYFQRKEEDFLSTEAKDVLNLISLQSEGSAAELERLLVQLKVEFYKYQQKKARLLIARHEREQNETELIKAITEFDNVSRELHTVITHGREEEKTTFPDQEVSGQQEEQEGANEEGGG